MDYISNNIVVKKQDSSVRAVGKTKADIWKETIEALVDPANGMEEEERANYEQKIVQKLKTGRRLTSEELNYLRIHNPELYQSAVRVETARKALREKLKNCKSKEEVQQVVSAQMESLKAMEKDPDIEYLSAMVKKEIEDFQKSSDYARLPKTREEGKKKVSKKSGLQSEETEGEEEECQKLAIYSRMQFQCDLIVQMAQAFI